MVDAPLAPVPSLPWRFSTRTVDLDEASAQGAEAYYPLRMRVLGRGRRFRMSIDAMQIGPVLVGDCRFDADIRMDFKDLGSFYHVNVPLSGHLASTNLGNAVTATPGEAVAFGPTGGICLDRWGAGSRVLCVKIRREALESELERLLQRPVRGPLVLGPSLDVRGGYGRELRELAVLLARQASRAASPVRREIIGAPLWHGMLVQVLAAVEHDYREELLHPGRSCRASVAERVIEAMRRSPRTPYAAADLAAIGRVSIRTLQAAFRSHVGMSPMAYLRQLRLERAREELAAAAPSETTVTEVAFGWGFTHLGRFAEQYARRFGELPSATLRSPDFTGDRAHFT